MATVIYKPPVKGIGESLGELAGAYASSKIIDSRKQDRAKAISDYLSAMNSGDPQALTTAQGQVNPDDLLKLLLIQNKKTKDLTKVDAYDKSGKKTAFAATAEDLASGVAEKNANSRELTLFKPADDNAGKPTDTDKAIADILGEKNLPSNATNRRKARGYLKDRNKAEEVINRSFGKKIGNDWEIEAGTKKEMADLATSQIEGLIFEDGLSAEQAGSVAVKIAQNAFKQRIDQENAPVIKKKEPGMFDKLQNMFKGDSTDGQVKKPADEGLEALGNIGGVEVGYPPEMSDPREIAAFVSKKYNIPFNDVRAWLLENSPSQ